MFKKFTFLSCLLLMATVSFGALTNPASNINWGSTRSYSDFVDNPLRLWVEEVDTALNGSGTTGFNDILMEPTTQPTSTEGRFYYDSVANGLKLYNGSAWVNIDTAGGGSLDQAYDVGNAITVDGNPVALTVGATDNNSALTISHGEVTNNNDAFTIAHSGSGDAIEVTIADTDGVAQRLIAAASQTTGLAVFDASTNNWDGADDVGILQINTDDPYIHGGATALLVSDSSTPITSAEGFLARFVHSGTARTNSSAVEIEVPATQPALATNGIVVLNGQDAAGAALLQVVGVGASGDADAMTITNTGAGDGLQITVGEADGVALRAIAAASQTTSLGVFDAATNNWDGADNVGLLHINTDDPFISAGASALQVVDSSTPISAAEGFLARFVHSGTARTNSSAVEIEVPATQPAFAANGIVAITGQDNPGAALVQVVGIDTSGNSDTMSIDHSGTGNGLYIDLNETDSQGLTIEPFTNATVAALEVDGDASGWDGADNVGMVHIRNDVPGIHAGATLLFVDDSSQPITAAEGFLARFVATGAARTNSSAVEIEVPATQPALAINGIVAISGQDAAGGAIFQVNGVGASGNADAMIITNTGSGDNLQVTVGEADGVGVNVIAATSQTTSLVKVDGTTGSYLGAANVGMIHVTNDGALADVASSLLYIANTGIPTDDSRGSSLRIVDTGNAAAGTAGYAVYISATDATVEAMYIDDGDVLIDDNLQVVGTSLPSTIVKKTITTSSITTADCGYVLQVSADAQTITLPATVAGVEFWIMCIAADGGALLSVAPNGSDKFIGSGFTPADAEAMTIPKATQNYGDYFKISAHVDGWIITEMVGTWAEATP